MERLIVKKINNYSYKLIDKNNRIYEVNLEIMGNYLPKENDIIYMNKKLLNEKQLLTFGPLEDIYGHTIKRIINNHEEEEIINIKNSEINIYLKRFYG